MDLSLLTVNELSEFYGVSLHIIYHMIERKQLTYIKINRLVRFHLQSFQVMDDRLIPVRMYKKTLRVLYSNLLSDYKDWVPMREFAEILNISISSAKRIIKAENIKKEVLHDTEKVLLYKRDLINLLVNKTVTAK